MPTIDERLNDWYREGEPTGDSLWPRIMQKMNSHGAAADTPTAPLPLRRRRVTFLAVRLASSAAIVATVGIGSLYASPRLDMTVYAMMNRSSANQPGLQSVLLNDPGLGVLWHAGSIHPVELSTTDKGVRMTVLGIWADANRTIVLFHLQSQQSSTVPVASPWTIVTDNSLSLGLSQLKSNTKTTVPTDTIRKYPVTLSDQFGIRRSWTGISFNVGSGYGYLQFPPFTAPERSAGLRLTLRVRAMQEILAPHGPLGDKEFVTRAGKWDFHFDYIPETTPALVLMPDTSATKGLDTMTLTYVKTTASETQLDLKSSDHPSAVSPNFRVTTPLGKSVLPMEVSTSGTYLHITLPPLTAAGSYTLFDRQKYSNEAGVTVESLRWTQPVWSGKKSQLVSSYHALPLYTGNDWSKAIRSLGYPILQPYKGYVVSHLSVNDTWQQAMSGPTRGPVPELSMTIRTPSGAVIAGTESRSFPNFLPIFDSLTEFQSSLKMTSNSSALSTVDLGGGRKGYLLSYKSPNQNGSTSKLRLLTVVLPWGNVTFGTTPAHDDVSSAVLVNTARAWLNQKLVTLK